MLTQVDIIDPNFEGEAKQVADKLVGDIQAKLEHSVLGQAGKGVQAQLDQTAVGQVAQNLQAQTDALAAGVLKGLPHL